MKKEVIALSTKYCISTEFTSFVAVEERDEAITDSLQQVTIPSNIRTLRKQEQPQVLAEGGILSPKNFAQPSMKSRKGGYSGGKKFASRRSSNPPTQVYLDSSEEECSKLMDDGYGGIPTLDMKKEIMPAQDMRSKKISSHVATSQSLSPVAPSPSPSLSSVAPSGSLPSKPLSVSSNSVSVIIFEQEKIDFFLKKTLNFSFFKKKKLGRRNY